MAISIVSAEKMDDNSIHIEFSDGNGIIFPSLRFMKNACRDFVSKENQKFLLLSIILATDGDLTFQNTVGKSLSFNAQTKTISVT